jgi:arginase family enzyme
LSSVRSEIAWRNRAFSDSHTDAYAYDPADKYNAATQFTHVAEEGLVDASLSWHVGIRGTTFAQGVVPRTRALGYRVIPLDELVRGGFSQRMAEFRDQAAGRPVYICFDMDVFDPSCAPGVCSPSWGGLSAREGTDLIRTLTDLNIVAVDVATVSPPQDVNNMAAHLCAHVIYEMLVLLCRQHGLAPQG